MIFTKQEYGMTFTAEAYSGDSKTWFWASNDNPVPLDAAAEYGIPIDKAAQAKAIDANHKHVIEEYRKAHKDGPSAEEKLEARAAHGPGIEMVNIFTGHRWTT